MLYACPIRLYIIVTITATKKKKSAVDKFPIYANTDQTN